tara:strand:+ start:258 stop:509 length:252 start_codon:yes stop_codon:yes gene_type:complete
MFDKDNFIKALMFLQQEACVANQENLAKILDEAIEQANNVTQLEYAPANQNEMSEIIDRFLNLDKQTQKILVDALELSENTNA